MSDEKEKKLSSANILLKRAPPEDYLTEWMEILREEKNAPQAYKEHNLLIFRIKKEWLALSTSVFYQICDMRPVHKIPHRKSPILLGIVNIEGQIRVSVSLDRLLDIGGEETASETNQITYMRNVVLEKNGDYWVFPVDEVYGIYRCPEDAIENVPVNLAKSSANFLKGIFNWEGHSVGYLDEELLFHSLKRSI